MGYVLLNIKEAKKIVKDDAMVLVSTQDLEIADCNIGFEKKKFADCKSIFEEAKTIAQFCDNFANQLRLFSEQQPDLYNIIPKGKMSTILYKE